MRSLAARTLLLPLLILVSASPVRAFDPRTGVSLDRTLTPYLSQYGLPALAAAVVRYGRVVASGAVGARRADAPIPVTVNDRFHLGSDTKAFTALLAGMLVEEGRLRWDSTLTEVFPELAPTADAEVRAVTLEQLLSHTSGMKDTDRATWLMTHSLVEYYGNLDETRYWILAQWVGQPLVNRPGTTFMYSNMGYLIAGAMEERVAGRTWEELVTERIFAPLRLTTAGLGFPAHIGKTDAPVGHIVANGQLKPMLPGPSGDNPAVLGPAGTGHMSILDFAAWAAWNAGEGRRGPALVQPATLVKLHTPVIDTPANPNHVPGTPSAGRYGLGWGQSTYEWASHPLLNHAGSNGTNLAHIVLDPSQDFGIVVTTNVTGADAERALFDLERVLYERFAMRR